MNRLSCLFLLAALCIVQPVLAGAKYSTQNVFICVMDGVRYSETFGDPSHKYIPHIWNDLRPQGTIYTNFYNAGITVTRPGHSSLVTGTWQTCSNDGPRMSMPSIFDYYLDECKVPRSKVWIIFGKGSYAFSPATAFPQYADCPKPNFEAGVGEDADGDEKVLARVFHVMETDHPSLVLINFGHTDSSGHGGPFAEHTKAIQTCDEMMWRLWQKIQTDSAYKDKTTLILTNDHGRHDEPHGDYNWHGCDCEGCQHIMLAVLGPDTPKNISISRRALLIDIAPTAGELLGFRTPLAKAEVLKDCLTHFEGVNKKEVRTVRAKRAVTQQEVAERDLVRIVADRLVSAAYQSEEAKRVRATWDHAEPTFSIRIALAGLLAASEKTRDPKYSEFVEEFLSKAANNGDAQSKRQWMYLRASLPTREKVEDSLAAEVLSEVGADKPEAHIPAACALAAQSSNYQKQAAQTMVQFLSARKHDYTPETVYHIIQTAVLCPHDDALMKESVFAAASLLNRIPECGGLADDPADSGLILCSLVQLERLQWWQKMRASQRLPWLEDPMPPALKSLTKEDLARLAEALGQPGSKSPLEAFQDAVALKGKTGLPYSVDLLRYCVHQAGYIPSRDLGLAAGAFLLLATEKEERR
ncbi:MAG: alkaline phosphatase family protein [Armatimonadetes bacterium]|nr:alkaline phosphatase family protein [Armatimonadota bacterium]